MTRQLSRERTETSSREFGGAMPLLVFGLLLLFAFAALVIDVGRMYKSRVALQNAADAGAMGGLGSTILDPWVREASSVQERSDRIEARARSIALENLIADGFPKIPLSHDSSELLDSSEPLWLSASHTPPSPANDYSDIVRVTINHTLPLLLLDLVPFEYFGTTRTPDSVELKVAATTRRPRVNVSLILDYSTSMNCPSHGSCTCLRPDREDADTQDPHVRCEAEAQQIAAANSDDPDLSALSDTDLNQKDEALRVAVEAFLEFFDQDRDRVNLVLFNTAATLDVPVRKPADPSNLQLSDLGFDPNDFTVALNASAPKGNTNVSDGFLTAYQDMCHGQIAGSELVHYVYLSDGAPTAARLLLSPANSGLLEQNEYDLVTDSHCDPATMNCCDAPGRYDYIHYTLQWVPQDGSPDYPGPSLLLKSGTIGRGPVVPVALGAELPACHRNASHLVASTANKDENEREYEAFYDQNLFEGQFIECLNTFAFHMPGDTSNIYGAGITGETSRYAASNLEDDDRWREQYFNAAVQMANFVRSRNGIVHVIGLGMNPPSVDLADPDRFQDMENTLNRKETFLRKMANAVESTYETAESAGVLAEDFDDHFEFNYTGSESYDPESPAQGYWLSDPSATQLPALFKQMATKILLQVIE